MFVCLHENKVPCDILNDKIWGKYIYIYIYSELLLLSLYITHVCIGNNEVK